MLRKLLVVALVLGMASSVFAQGNITAGNAWFRFTSIPTSSTSTTGTSSAHFSASASASGDQMFGTWWWFRLPGATRESSFSNAAGQGFSQTYVGDIATLSWTNVAGAGLMSATLRYDIDDMDGAGTTMARVTATMVVTNLSTVAPLAVSLFNYADYDVLGTASGDSAVLLATNRMGISEGAISTEFFGPNANAWEVDPWSTTAAGAVRVRMTDAVVDNLDNTGLPQGPFDFTGAYQWNLNLAPGGSATVYGGLSINTSAIPEPTTMALLALGGLVAIRRRR